MNSVCHKCGKLGHYKSVCRSKSVQPSDFANNCGFTHTTSSPCYPQGNGAAERGVRTMKALLGKSEDPYSALLAYHATPLENGYSPAE